MNRIPRIPRFFLDLVSLYIGDDVMIEYFNGQQLCGTICDVYYDHDTLVLRNTTVRRRPHGPDSFFEYLPINACGIVRVVFSSSQPRDAERFELAEGIWRELDLFRERRGRTAGESYLFYVTSEKESSSKPSNEYILNVYT
ncbi:hypothetical protein GE061_001048 [Apolygus lucorum]|uniref:LSM domain-containing protein n=1 Tax=Apolygus lucorum TaxID=248454 RepID=A0A8S9Y5Y7_APOLU|nr:hypothetical protein GE061_001048 [Apolygus lucorum]